MNSFFIRKRHLQLIIPTYKFNSFFYIFHQKNLRWTVGLWTFWCYSQWASENNPAVTYSKKTKHVTKHRHKGILKQHWSISLNWSISKLNTNPFNEEIVFPSVPPTRFPESPCCCDSICPASLCPASSRLDVSWLISEDIVDDSPFSIKWKGAL